MKQRTAPRKQKRLLGVVGLILAIAGGLTALLLYVTRYDISVLSPKGKIADEQYELIVLTALLSLIIVVPVFALTFFIAWKYRASNKKAKYSPDWDGNRWLEGVWWLVPFALISVLAVITWRSSHALDPYRPIDSDKKALTVQVVALEWKWLFIYPEQGIATVNHLQIPEDTPINFEITADAPMNSFWIPKLGGQIYAMAGMTTKLHLMANDKGEYPGSSANISGEGFADMQFITKVTSEQEFSDWAKGVGRGNVQLDRDSYNALAEPSRDHPHTFYSSVSGDLYDTVIMKYMMPGMQHDSPRRGSNEGHH